MFAPRPARSPSFSFPVQCNWLKLNGSWPVRKDNTAFGFFYYYWSIFVILLVAATCTFQVWYMVDNIGDILKVTENCCTSFMGLHTLLRLIHMWFKRRQMKTLMANFTQHIYVTTITDAKIKAQCNRELVVYSVMSAMLFSLICMYCILPLAELFSDLNAPERPFPYKMVFPYYAQRGAPYVITYIYTAFAGFVAVTTLFSEDSLFGFFIIHTCGRFKVLHKQIEQILPKSYSFAFDKYGEDVTEKVIQNEYNLELRRIIREHNVLIKFCMDLDDFCSPYLLANFLISSLLICVVGFQLFTVKMSLVNLIKFGVYIISELSQLFIICWSGDKLINNSMDTAWKLYSCNWEGTSMSLYKGSGRNGNEEYRCPSDIEFMKRMILVMLRSQKPLRITALKFSVLSLQSFTKILSTSMSYFTLLQAVYGKE